MKALILAGGMGTRLRPLTFAIPKPLIPVNETPIIEIIIKHLRKHGVREIFISTNYKSEILKLFLGDGSKWGAKIRFIDETKRMGTAGPIALVDLPEGEDLLVMNGDILTTLDVGKMLRWHKRHKALFTVGTVERSYQSRFGEIQLKPRSPRLADIVEKPVHSVIISAGIYIVGMRIRKFMSADEPIDMPNLMKRLMAKKETVIHYPIREEWDAIEMLSDYAKLHKD